MNSKLKNTCSNLWVARTAQLQSVHLRLFSSICLYISFHLFFSLRSPFYSFRFQLLSSLSPAALSWSIVPVRFSCCQCLQVMFWSIVLITACLLFQLPPVELLLCVSIFTLIFHHFVVAFLSMIVGNIFAFVLMTSSYPTVRNIVATQTYEHFNPLPVVAMSLESLVWVIYGTAIHGLTGRGSPNSNRSNQREAFRIGTTQIACSQYQKACCRRLSIPLRLHYVVVFCFRVIPVSHVFERLWCSDRLAVLAYSLLHPCFVSLC